MIIKFIKSLLGINTLDVELLKTKLGKGAFLVDVRTAAEFQGGHATGSVNIPLDQISQKINQFRDKPSIILVCRSGARAGQAKNILVKNGISNVTNLGAWQSANFTTTN